MNKILLDTNFYVNLFNSKAPLHENSKEYFDYFLKKDIPMLLSVVVLGEYCVKCPESDLPTRKSQILNYNLSHARKAAEFAEVLYAAKKLKVFDEEKVIINNDVKLFAQAHVEGADYFVTADKRCKPLYETLFKAGKVSFRFMEFKEPIATYTGKAVTISKRSIQVSLFD